MSKENEMEGAHKRLFEISKLMQEDAEGNALMEEVLNACFDCSLLTIDAKPELADEDRTHRLPRLMAVLERFNVYVSGRFPLFKEGIFQGTDNEVALWSEDLTYQILMNRPN
jgi:hypothetical protein